MTWLLSGMTRFNLKSPPDDRGEGRRKLSLRQSDRLQTAMVSLESEGELFELGALFFHLGDQPKGLTPATSPSL